MHMCIAVWMLRTTTAVRCGAAILSQPPIEARCLGLSSSLSSLLPASSGRCRFPARLRHCRHLQCDIVECRPLAAVATAARRRHITPAATAGALVDELRLDAVLLLLALAIDILRGQRGVHMREDERGDERRERDETQTDRCHTARHISGSHISMAVTCTPHILSSAYRRSEVVHSLALYESIPQYRIPSLESI
jgi:hypothetical protein